MQVSKQVKALEFHQDLVIVSAGGNDVGFDDVLKKCVYLPYPESACDGAFTNTQALINHGLERSIDNLLDDLDRIMNVNGIVVYTKYAKFFNADTDACDDKSWTYLDPTGSSGLKMTKARRKRMNDMVDSANCKIQNTIDSFNGRYLFAKMKLVTAEWENFVGATFGHFCEDGASEDPDNNIGLAFQRQDSTPQFVPPGKDKLDAVQVRREFLSGEAQSDSARLESRAPDAIARVFHPSIYGQSVIATMAMSAFISARASQILGTSSPISNCSHKVTPQGLPASDAKDTLGKTIEPACGKCSDMQIDPSDIGAAIQDYCSNNGKPFFRGDKTINNAIGSLSDHIMTMGTSLKDQAGSFYQDANSCKYVATMTAPLTIAKITMLIKPVVRTFDEKINTGDCTFALQVIDKKCETCTRSVYLDPSLVKVFTQVTLPAKFKVIVQVRIHTSVLRGASEPIRDECCMEGRWTAQ